MAGENRLELTVVIDPKQANSALGSVNKSLTDVEQAAARTTIRASQSFDGMASSMFKGVLAGNAVYDMAKRAFEAIREFTLGAIETQHEMGEMAQKVGLSVEELSAFSHVAKLSDLDTRDLGVTIGLLSKNMLMAAQGVATQRQHFASLGISVKNTDGTLRSVTSVLEDVADRFKAMPDGATKTALSLELMGRTGKQMIPVLNQGGDSIRAMMEEAKTLGLVIGGETAEAADRFHKNMVDLRGAAEGLSYKVAEELLPDLLEFTDAAVKWVKEGGMQKLAAQIRDVAEWVKNLGMWIVSYAVVAGILKASGAVIEFAASIGTLNAALLANPFGLAAIGIATLGYAMWKEYEKIGKTTQALEGLNRQAALLGEFKSGKKLEDLKKLGYTDEEMKAAIVGPGAGGLKFGPEPFKVKGFGGPENPPIEDLDAAKQAERIQKFILDANRAAAEFRRSAEEAAAAGPAKSIMEVAKEIDRLTTFVDDKGLETKVKLSADARANIEKALQVKIQDLQKDSAIKIVKDYRDADQKRFEADTEYYRKKLELEDSLASQELDNATRLLQYQEDRAGVLRDAALRQVDLDEARPGTLSGPKAVEQQAALAARKADIEIEYMQQVHDVKTILFDSETNQIIFQMNLQRDFLALVGQDVTNIDQMIADIQAQRAQLRGEMDEQTAAGIVAALQNAVIKQAQLVRDENQRTFDSFKRQAEGIFDALVTRSGSVFSAMANIFKTAMLTAIKDVVTSQVARMMMQLFRGGGTGAGAPAGGGGGGFGGILGGMVPILGAGGGGFGGGTPPFMPGGGAGGAGGAGGLFNLAGLKAMGGNLKGFIGMGKGASDEAAGIYGAGSGQGFSMSGLAHSNAMLLGGILAAYGLKRGGLSGLAMSTAGGGMIGYKYGGPLGAAIGAGIGAIAGTIRMFVKGAKEKARAKIKAMYGVDIKDNGVLGQIVDMAKQSYGGNIDMAIQTPEIRDLIELYAQTTGQKSSGMPAKMTALSLVQSGGSISQPGGSASMPMGGLPGTGLGGVSVGGASNGGPLIINVNVPGAKEFFQKETVQVVLDNPKAVSTANVSATRANFNRREITGLQLSPGTLTS